MKLKEAYLKLKDEFSPIEISNIKDINQDGLYLSFLGLQNQATTKDIASFALVFAANTLCKDNYKPLDDLEVLRKKVFNLGAKEGKNYFKALKGASFEGATLYMYAFIVDIEIEAY